LIIRSVVVLPQPLVPSNTTFSPSSTVNEILSTATLFPKILLTRSTTIVVFLLTDKKIILSAKEISFIFIVLIVLKIIENYKSSKGMALQRFFPAQNNCKE